MYGECWFTGNFYFKHGGSQNATLIDYRSIYYINVDSYITARFMKLLDDCHITDKSISFKFRSIHYINDRLLLHRSIITLLVDLLHRRSIRHIAGRLLPHRSSISLLVDLLQCRSIRDITGRLLLHLITITLPIDELHCG